jgi:hypothetical protein
MIELATIKAVVDLFKEFLGLIEQGEKNKRELFERTCKPLYDRLEVAFKQYYAMVATTSRRLHEDDPDLAAILREMNEQREALVITRNGIVGEAVGFLTHYAAIPDDRIGQFDRLVRAFADT